MGLHFNLYNASKSGKNYDLRKVFDNTTVNTHPTLAVTFVDNHDSQPGQSLESFIDPRFKEIAYGIIFLRKNGYPCLFYGDYYGTSGDDPQVGFKEQIDKFAKIRKKFAYGDEEHLNKSAVIISNGDMNTIRMFLGKDETNKVYAYYMGNSEEKIIIDKEGFGSFMVGARSISVWVKDGVEL